MRMRIWLPRLPYIASSAARKLSYPLTCSINSRVTVVNIGSYVCLCILQIWSNYGARNAEFRASIETMVHESDDAHDPMVWYVRY